MNGRGRTGTNPHTAFQIAGTISVAALVLSWVALLNGHPLLFDDTLTYLLDGMNLVRLKKWPEPQRPVFYGLTIWFLHLEKTLWPVVFAQGLVVAHLIWLTLRVQGLEVRPAAFLGLIVLLAVATPVSWYVAHILPDVFLGVLILGTYLLGFCRDRLSRAETVYLFVLVTASICFHLTYIVCAFVMTAACTIVWIVSPRLRPMARPVLLIGAFALALAAIYSFNLVVYKRLSLMPNGQPPLLLARMLADGESKAYLRAVCPQRSYALCPYLNQLPETSDEIVWHFLPKLTASKPELWNIVRSEQRSIIIGTVLTFPAWTARSVISNILRQLVTFDSAAWFYKDSRRWLLDQFPFAGTGYLGSLQDRGFLSVRAMGSVNRFHTAVIVISLLAAVHFGIRCVSAVEFRPVVLALVVALGLVANAFVCTLSGVYGRFEGRGIWLIPFCAVMLGLGAVAFERRSKR